MRWSIFLFVLVFASSVGCSHEAAQGEWCEGSVLDDVHCAQGLTCDDHANWTCQPPPDSSSYPASPSYPTAPDDASSSVDAGLVDAQTGEADASDAAPVDGQASAPN